MQAKRFGDTYAVRIDLGEEIMKELTALCDREGIQFAEVSGDQKVQKCADNRTQGDGLGQRSQGIIEYFPVFTWSFVNSIPLQSLDLSN